MIIAKEGNNMINVEDQIEELKIDKKIIKKLVDNNINYIKDLWILKRKDLKMMSFSDIEIKKITIALQLSGLDLNKKMYD